jgi:alpha-amylase
VVTGFGPNVRLHDYTGHAADIWTDGEGHVSMDVPRNAGGLGYVCYSVAGIDGRFAAVPSAVTQTFEGATDLDIKPADNTATVLVSRIWVAGETQITASLTFDDTGWTAKTQIVLSLQGPSGVTLWTKIYGPGSSGNQIPATAGAEGWYSFYIHSSNTPAPDPKPAYKLTVNYTAPRV